DGRGGVFDVSELDQPATQDVVDRLRADDLVGGPLEVGGGGGQRGRLRAAEPAVRSDQFLEGGDFRRLGPVGAVDHQVRAVGEAVGAPQVIGGVGAEGRERVLAGAPAESEVGDGAGG